VADVFPVLLNSFQVYLALWLWGSYATKIVIEINNIRSSVAKRSVLEEVNPDADRIWGHAPGKFPLASSTRG